MKLVSLPGLTGAAGQAAPLIHLESFRVCEKASGTLTPELPEGCFANECPTPFHRLLPKTRLVSLRSLTSEIGFQTGLQVRFLSPCRRTFREGGGRG
jgi:hypothetical protein